MKKVFSLALAALSLSAFAGPPEHIDVSALPAHAKMIEDVVVPVPSEIFGVLDKLGHPGWKDVEHPTAGVAQPLGEQPQIALQLGAVIAEGFIAVEAEDATEVKQIGKSVLNLSKALGVEREVKSRALAITTAADMKNWSDVRRELDGALGDVKKAMAKLDSESLSQLVSLGGWLRGTEALTAVVGKTYTKDGADLLHQPVLLDYFEKRLAALKPRYKANPVIIKVNKGVLDIRPLVGLGTDSDISEKSVKEINAIAADLLNAINSKAP
jgi:hypothetical protein